MNKKHILTIGFLATAVIAASVISPKIMGASTFATDFEGAPDCESLAYNMDTIKDILTREYCEHTSHVSGETVSTWGTVTAIYQQSNYHHVFIQNNYRNTGSGALCLYKLGSTASACPVEVGDFVTVEGKLTYYNGMYEMIMTDPGNSYEVKPQADAYEVESVAFTETQLTATPGGTTWTDNITTGNIRGHVNNATIKSVGDTYALLSFPGSTETFKAYYGGISATSDIAAALSNALDSGKKVNITGYLDVFDKTGSQESQLYVRYASDIKEVTGSEVPVTSVSVSLADTDLVVGDIVTATATVSPSNATNKDVEWYSNDTDVAVVSNNGTITAVGEGTCRVYATAISNRSIFGYVEISVEDSSDIEPTDLLFDVSGFRYDSNYYAYMLHEGDSGVFTYDVFPAGAILNDVKFELYFGFDSLELNEDTGEWYAKGQGNAVVRVYSPSTGLEDAVYFFVTPNSTDISSITIQEEDSLTLELDEFYTVSYTTDPITFIDYVTWPSSVSTSDIFDVVYASGGEAQIYAEKVGTDTLTLQAYNPSTGTVVEDSIEITVVDNGGGGGGGGGGGTSSDTITIDMYDINPGSYSSNWKSYYQDDMNFFVYRAKSNGSYLTFYPNSNIKNTSGIDTKYSLPGAFYNESALYEITSIEVEYSGAGVLRYGNDKNCTSSTSLTNKSTAGSQTVTTTGSYFFYVEASSSAAINVYSVTLHFDLTDEYSGSITHKTTSDSRIPATVYSGSLVDGVSYVDVPTSVTINGNYYTVNSTKRYTYYSFSYVKNNRNTLDLDEIAMTDPVDIANYYIAFHCVPANFAAKNNVDETYDDDIGDLSTIKSIFGNKARYVSQYNRTNGYAVGLPYYGSTPTYLEFDYDGGSNYSTSSRDVCRVVLWATGWKGTGYGQNIPVATLTDDHYATFREYLNYGVFGTAFDSKEGDYASCRTNYYYGSTKTLTAK